MSDWCILRCSGRHTLPLAESLNRGGFEVWTPAAKVRQQKRRGKVDAPILPTYVFARAGGLDGLLQIADALQSPHPDFSVFHYLDRIPLIAECELAALRLAERRGQPRPKPRDFEEGDVVQAIDGAWAGMSGVVERKKRKFVMVLFPGSKLSVKIATFRLHPGERQAA